MSNSGLTAGDIMALTKDNDGFGGVGLIILLFIFLIGLSGNGFGFGNNGTQWGINDIQNSLYNQTQDANARALTAQLATVNDTVLNNKYDNAILIKDLSNQMSNSIAGISNQIANQTATITNLFNEQTIDRLRDSLATTRDELSNTRQTGIITSAINNQTSEILNAQGKYYMNAPCYQNCGGCCNGLY
ncbi:hypothetical protein IKS57_01720 [bacterium]|nr:hypothetical protein [bacterium]